MKILLLLITMFVLGYSSYAQSGPTPIPKLPQNLGAKGTKITVKDQLKVDSVLFAENFRTKNIFADTLFEPDFEIDVLPDLQYQTMTGIPPNCSLPDSGLVAYTFNWICANKVPANIKAVLQVGDLTDDGNNSQFARVDSNYDKFDNNNIPYLYVLGNHDYNGGNPGGGTRLTSIYNTWMGPSRYTGKTYYGGNMDGTNDNYYIKLDIGRKKFIVIGLEFMPRDAIIVWAQAILDANKDREAIIVTHALVTGWGEKSKDSSDATGGYGIADANNGTELWDKLIRKNKQIIMTLNGHYNRCCGGGCASITNTSLGDPVDLRLTQTGDNGNIVHMLVYNHQSDSLGGAGHIMRLKFKPSTSTIDVSFFNARYQGNDPRRPSYSLYYPPVNLEGSMGVKGSFNVAGETTFDSTVKITKLPKWRLVTTGPNGLLDSLPAADSTYIPVSQGKNKPFKMDSMPGNSNAYIRNILPIPSVATGYQLANIWIRGTAVVGGPTGTFANPGGAPLTMAISHQSGNFGLGIQRAAGVNQSGANLSFSHTYGADWTTQVPVALGAELGVISFFGTATNLLLSRGASYRSNVRSVGANFISAGHEFRVIDAANIERTPLIMTPLGYNGTGGVVIGSNTWLSTDRLLVVGNTRITDSLKIETIPVSTVATDSFLLVHDNVVYKAPRTDPYKQYVAFLTQSGTSAPVATVLENEIGSIIWTRNNVGDYTGTLSGAFVAGKTFIIVSNYSNDVEGGVIQIQMERVDNNTITFQVGIAGNKTDGVFNAGDGLPIEIRVYP